MLSAEASLIFCHFHARTHFQVETVFCIESNPRLKMPCKDHNLNITTTSTNELLIIIERAMVLLHREWSACYHGEYQLFLQALPTAAAWALVTGVNPVLMGTSGNSGKIHPCQRWVERDGLVPQQHPWMSMAAGASWQPGCPAGEVSLLWGDLTAHPPHRNPELCTWACCSSPQSTHQVS